jgi:hypothetical protein
MADKSRKRVLNPTEPIKRYFMPTVPFEVAEGVPPQPKIHQNLTPKKQNQSPQLQLISDSLKAEITITQDTTEEEVVERFRILKGDFKEFERQRVLEEAERAVVGVESAYGGNSWGTQPTLYEEKRKFENSPPKKVEKRLQELKDIIKRYEEFPTLYAQKIGENLPVNWKDEYLTVGEAVKGRTDKYKLATVAQAVGYYQEIVEIAQDVLNKKLAFVAQHASEVSGLVKKCNELTKKASKIQAQVFTLLAKANYGLSQKEKQKTLSLILKHKELQRLHDGASAKVALYSPNNPTAGLLSFPSSNYRLPSWLRDRLEDAERGTEISA